VMEMAAEGSVMIDLDLAVGLCRYARSGALLDQGDPGPVGIVFRSPAMVLALDRASMVNRSNRLP
jgi:hypothetical protein